MTIYMYVRYAVDIVGIVIAELTRSNSTITIYAPSEAHSSDISC